MATQAVYSFPPEGSLETPEVLRALARAHRYLGELKGTAKTIPNGNNRLMDQLWCATGDDLVQF